MLLPLLEIFPGLPASQGQRPRSLLTFERSVRWACTFPAPAPAHSSPHVPCPPCTDTHPSLSLPLATNPVNPTSFSSSITSPRKPTLNPRPGFTAPQHLHLHQQKSIPPTGQPPFPFLRAKKAHVPSVPSASRRPGAWEMEKAGHAIPSGPLSPPTQPLCTEWARY